MPRSRTHPRMPRLRLEGGIFALAVAIAFTVLWITGHYRHDVLTLRLTAEHSVWAETVRGSIQVVSETNTFPEMFQSGWQSSEAIGPLPSNSRWGFGWVSTTLPVNDGQTARTIGISALAIPPAVPAAVFGLVAVLALRTWYRAHRRQVEGRCPSCGYDLRASGDRCPECGAMVRGQPAGA